MDIDYYRKWYVPFESRKGTQYYIIIFTDEFYEGNLIQLTGADVPFETNEEDDDDIFLPLRGQTGYIRVVDSTGTLLEELMPNTNLSRYVQVCTGSLSSGSLTMVWQGYIASDAFSQPWENGAHELEFPVISPIAALEYSSITLNDIAGTSRLTIAQYFELAFESLPFISGANPYNQVVLHYDTTDMFASWYLAPTQFFERNEDKTVGETRIIVTGKSWLDILTQLCAFMGCFLREDAGILYITQVLSPSASNYIYTWGDWSNPTSSSDNWVALYSSLSPRSNDASTSYIQGAKEAVVEVSVFDGEPSLALPTTSIDASTVYEVIMDGNQGVLYVQIHEPRSYSGETYTYHKYNMTTDLGESTYENCVDSSDIINPGWLWDSVRGDSEKELTTGAFPVRWYYLATGSASDYTLTNGLAINCIPGYYTDLTGTVAYTLDSMVPYSFKSEGYIKIKMKLDAIVWSVQGSPLINMSSHPSLYICNLYIGIRCGDYVWTNSGWSQGGSESRYEIVFKGSEGALEFSNQTSYTIPEENALIIPSPGNITGDISISIYGYSKSTTIWQVYNDTHTLILSNLSVSFVNMSSSTVESGDNKYRETILAQGFTGEKKIDLDVGSYNNNEHSPSFFTDSTGENYLEVAPIALEASEGVIIREYIRPELALIYKLKKYYGKVRRVRTITVDNISVIGAHYYILDATGDDTALYAVLANRNWREDEAEIKIIEEQQIDEI